MARNFNVLRSKLIVDALNKMLAEDTDERGRSLGRFTERERAMLEAAVEQIERADDYLV